METLSISKKNVNKIPVIEVFGSNLSFTIRVFAWGFAGFSLCKKNAAQFDH